MGWVERAAGSGVPPGRRSVFPQEPGVERRAIVNCPYATAVFALRSRDAWRLRVQHALASAGEAAGATSGATKNGRGFDPRPEFPE
jgi:hypothetical protein